jgi:hypothetical protein
MPTDSGATRWSRLFQHPIVVGVVLAIVGGAVTVAVGALSKEEPPPPPSTGPPSTVSTSSQPLSVVVERGRGENYAVTLPGPLPSPLPVGLDLEKSLRDQHAAIDGVTRRRIVVEGKASSTVTVTGMRARIVRELPPYPTAVALPPEGEGFVVTAGFNLDGPDYQALETSDDGTWEPRLGASLFGRRTVTVAPGEIVTFDVVAYGRRARYEWVISLEYVLAGERRNLEIRDLDGKPFRTSPVDSLACQSRFIVVTEATGRWTPANDCGP